MKTGAFVINIWAAALPGVLLQAYSPVMNRWHDKLSLLTRRYETLLFACLLPWIAVGHLLEGQAHSWFQYGHSLLILILVQLPVLVFSWYEERLRQRRSARQFRLYWLACYGVYLPALIIGASAWMQPGSTVRALIIACGLCDLLLKLVLLADAWYRKRLRQVKWIKRLSLERSVLITITLVSVILSAMAVSSIGNPAYDSKEQLLIGYEFDPGKVLAQSGKFSGFVAQFLFMYLCGYLLFYINDKILVARVLKRKGLVLYLLSALALVGILYPVMAQALTALPLSRRLGGMFPGNPFELENAFAAMAIIIFSLPVLLSVQWSRQNNRILLLEKEKAQTELDLLKQQLNPHFFFNTLNNLYALSLQQSQQTPECILRLSELMRYVIYKAKEPQVSIQEEIKYLEDYIELQQIRMKRKPVIAFTKEIATDAAPIAPLLLIVLVENAFKHGIEPAEQETFLHLSLKATARGLCFSCTNSFEDNAGTSIGIGIENLRRRLSLLYPGKHVFTTGMENHIFKAELELKLS